MAYVPSMRLGGENGESVWIGDRPSVGEHVIRRSAGTFVASLIEYPVGALTALHAHTTAGLSFVVKGAIEKRIGRQLHVCTREVSTFEPPGTLHAEAFVGATQTLLIEAASEQFGALGDTLPALRSPVVSRHARTIAAGRRAFDEFSIRDTASTLGIEAAALDWAISVAAQRRSRQHVAAPPRWLSAIADRLSDDWRSTPSLTELAAISSVHPTHLTRTFRRQYGCTVGEYLRGRRVGWAAGMLLTTTRSLASIAVAAGFWDQSHFTRVFATIMGASPAQFRRVRLAGATLRRGARTHE